MDIIHDDCFGRRSSVLSDSPTRCDDVRRHGVLYDASRLRHQPRGFSRRTYHGAQIFLHMVVSLMRRLITAIFFLIPTCVFAAGFSGDGFGAPGLFQFNVVGGLGTCLASQNFFARAAVNIAAAVGAGAPGISTWESAIDGLICGQVTGGTWAKKDVEYFTVAPTLALAEMNLVSSSFTLVPQAGVPAFVANAGVTGAASTTGYYDTGYKPNSGQMTNASVLIGACVLNNRTSLLTSSFATEVGTQIASNFFNAAVLTGSGTSTASSFGVGGNGVMNVNSSTITTTRGGFFTARTATNVTAAYANSGSVGSATTTVATLAGFGNFFVLGLDNSGTLFGNALADTIGAVVLGSGETSTQVFADEALFTTALTAVGIASGC